MKFPKTLTDRFSYSLIVIVLFGLMLHFWGVVLNQTALIMNNGEMPVKVNSQYAIIDDHGRFKHHVADENTSVLFLTDWIIVNFFEIERPVGFISSKIYTVYEKTLNYPVEGGLNAISIGDIFRWIGATLFLACLPLLLLGIPVQIFYERNRRN